MTILLLFLPFLITAQETDAVPAKKETGYCNHTSFGLLIGSGKDDQTYISSFQMEHDYQFSKYFSFGLHTGVTWTDIMVAPIGANLKLMLPRPGSEVFYLSGTLGQAIALEDKHHEYFEVIDTNGGPFVNAEAGFVLPSKKRYSLYIAAGYYYLETSFTRRDWWLTEVDRTITYNRFLIKVGVKIN